MYFHLMSKLTPGITCLKEKKKRTSKIISIYPLKYTYIFIYKPP